MGKINNMNPYLLKRKAIKSMG